MFSNGKVATLEQSNAALQEALKKQTVENKKLLQRVSDLESALEDLEYFKRLVKNLNYENKILKDAYGEIMAGPSLEAGYACAKILLNHYYKTGKKLSRRKSDKLLNIPEHYHALAVAFIQLSGSYDSGDLEVAQILLLRTFKRVQYNIEEIRAKFPVSKQNDYDF